MFDNLFKEGRIGNLIIKNRSVVPPMLTEYANEDGSINERLIRYYEEKAKGDFGLIIVEDTAIEPGGRGFKFLIGLWDEKFIDKHKELTRRVKKYGSKIFIQLYHAGREGSMRAGGERIVGPSAIQDPTSRELPRELTTKEVEEIVYKYVKAAIYAKESGYDGVELHGAHGYLINQFLSPYSNKRTDKYGGSFLNRLNFPLEIIKGIRENCGEDFALCYRITADEMVEGGISIEDSKIIVPILESAGVDAIHVSASVYKTGYYASAPMSSESIPFIKYSREIKQVVSIPVIGVNKINNPFIAESILKQGYSDFVSLGRASIADPYIIKKTYEGKLEDINYCIGCWQGCQGNLPKEKSVTCLVNPIVGREWEIEVKKSNTIKRIMIIGGGVSGMQAAVTLSDRGHEVYLYEKEDRLGGQYLFAAIPPGKELFNNFIIYLKKLIEDKRINVHLNTNVTKDIIEKLNPDHIVISTGSSQIVPKIKGIDKDHVVLGNDILKGKCLIKNNAVIIGGGAVGAEVLAHVCEHTGSGIVIEMGDKFGTGMVMAPKVFLKKHLKHCNGKVMLNTKVIEIKDDLVVVENQGKISEILCNQVVLCIGSKSENSIKELIDGTYEYSVIGDALKVSNALEGVKQGFELGLKI